MNTGKAVVAVDECQRSRAGRAVFYSLMDSTDSYPYTCGELTLVGCRTNRRVAETLPALRNETYRLLYMCVWSEIHIYDTSVHAIPHRYPPP